MAETQDEPHGPAPAVTGVMAALKEAGDEFARLGAHYDDVLKQTEASIRGASDGPAHAIEEMVTKARADIGGMRERAIGQASKCRRAAAELEALLGASFERAARPRTEPASPSALFRMGFEYGATAAHYEHLNDEERIGRTPPPPTWEAAWAVARGQLAAAK